MARDYDRETPGVWVDRLRDRQQDHLGKPMMDSYWKTVDAIEVKWPTTQKVERFTQVKANQIITIREGGGIVQPANTK